MKIDITLKITPEMRKNAQGKENTAPVGHLGTHFDVMNKQFPLDYTTRSGIVFDVSHITDRDIEATDVALDRVQADMFVAFYSGFIEEEPYGTKRYFGEHPQLSEELIEALLERKISIIGIDFSGIRRGGEHIPKDQYCADRGVFVVENLCNLKSVIDAGGTFTAHTYPINYTEMTGLPCRVVAEV